MNEIARPTASKVLLTGERRFPMESGKICRCQDMLSLRRRWTPGHPSLRLKVTASREECCFVWTKHGYLAQKQLHVGILVPLQASNWSATMNIAWEDGLGHNSEDLAEESEHEHDVPISWQKVGICRDINATTHSDLIIIIVACHRGSWYLEFKLAVMHQNRLWDFRGLSCQSVSLVEAGTRILTHLFVFFWFKKALPNGAR